jgi:hypothetical protein
MNEKTTFVLIAAGTAVALYFVNQAGQNIGAGVGTGAELAGGGVGAAAVIGVLILLL